CGYWLMGRLVTERKPSTRISRLSTAASTGRRMKRSVKFIGPGLLFLRRWIRIVGRRHAVVDDERRAIFQLELPAGDDRRAFLDAAQDRPLVAARRSDIDENLLGDGGRRRTRRRTLAGWRTTRRRTLGGWRRRLRNEHAGAVRVVGDRRLRHGEIAIH